MAGDQPAMPDENAERCLNCAAPVAEAFCSKCGQDNRERRLTARRVLRKSFEEITELEAPLLRTIADRLFKGDGYPTCLIETSKS